MTTIKPLPTKTQPERVNIRQLGFRDGLEFSFGFWVGSLLFFIIVGPAAACIAQVIIGRL